MTLKVIDTGNFMCDGGAIFGVVPKVMWQKHYPCNEQNYCNLSMRSLLVITGDRVILIDTGCGNKQDDKFYAYYYLNGDQTLLGSLNDAGYTPDDVTDVVLTHLHFDHCGGCTQKNPDGTFSVVFRNATHWVGASQWANYLNPNVREGDAYFKEDMMPVFDAGMLRLVEEPMQIAPGFGVELFNGHTPGQLLPLVEYNGRTVAYTGDLIPVMASIPLSWVSAYDLYPVTSMVEKEAFLNRACNEGYVLFFEHDVYSQCCTLQRTEKGVRPLRKGMLQDF